MAKFRRNHERNSNPFVGLTLRVFIIMAILIVLFFGVQSFFNNNTEYRSDHYVDSDFKIERDYLPRTNDPLEIIHKEYYSLGYDEDLEMSKWVAYILTKEDLRLPKCEKT